MTHEKDFGMNLDAALMHGIDMRGRRIFVQGDVDGESIAVAIRGMYLMADASDDVPIELFITSYGGSIDQTFALHDVTRTIRCPVHTIALGMCHSAAPLLVASGARGYRYASENCEFMLHPASMGIEGTITNIAGTTAAVTRRCERMSRLLAKYTGKPYRFWSKFDRGDDCYFTAEQARDWGLIDHIWSEKP